MAKNNLITVEFLRDFGLKKAGEAGQYDGMLVSDMLKRGFVKIVPNNEQQSVQAAVVISAPTSEPVKPQPKNKKNENKV